MTKQYFGRDYYGRVKKKLRYQKEAFRINVSGSGSFEAFARDGIIRPMFKKAKETMYDSAVRERVGALAFAYLSRKDWKWEVPDGMPEV